MNAQQEQKILLDTFAFFMRNLTEQVTAPLTLGDAEIVFSRSRNFIPAIVQVRIRRQGRYTVYAGESWAVCLCKALAGALQAATTERHRAEEIERAQDQENDVIRAALEIIKTVKQLNSRELKTITDAVYITAPEQHAWTIGGIDDD